MADDTPTTDATPDAGPAPVPAPPEPSWAAVPDAPVPVILAAKGNTCKTCKNALTVYDGTNPSKIGTGFCDVCGTRQVLKG